MNWWRSLLAVSVLISAVHAEEPVDYLTQVKPVLQARCYACHGALKSQAKLRLDTAVSAIRGGESGAAIKPGDPAASRLLQRITATDETERMPPEGEPLQPAEISAIRAWIAQGAKAPDDEPPERDPRDHWAFRVPVRPAVPNVADASWVRNPIDAFIAARHEQLGLQRQPATDKRVWLRRVTLDLIGLPPTPQELAAFVEDDTDEAYDRVVTRLLNSPQYGERWGRHWMDIWRYSDWWGLGAEVRNSQKHIWHWRDWIIESLNADKGYDQMLREMLAADELYPNNLDRLRGGGFLARHYFKFNRTTWLDGVIEHTAKSFLGMTFNCAKCHDHKYDPLTQEEYYRLRAIFEPYQLRTDAVPGVTDFETNGIPHAFDCNLDAPTFLHIRGDDRNPDKSRPIAPAVPAFLSLGEFRIEPVTLPPEAAQPGLRPFVAESYIQQAERRIAAAQSALKTAQQQLEAAEQAETLNTTNLDAAAKTLPVDQARLAVGIAQKELAAAEAALASVKARASADRAQFAEPPASDVSAQIAAAVRAERLATIADHEVAVLRAELEWLKATPAKKPDTEKRLAAAQSALESARKTLDLPGDKYTSLVGALKTLESNLETEASRQKPFPKTSTGRRSAFALWITDPRNPLPARVAVNHLWSRHFGQPLVPTVFDFGRKGTPPTHPELLDWLAVEFVEHGWSMKHIHRLIVTSNTYRLSSSSAAASPQTLAADPDNRWHWRANPMRMEAQVVRDSLLALAGELDLTMGGPSIPVNQESNRRSLYFVHSHNDHQKFLSMFDDANVLECYRRAESIVPQQALALENSPFVTACAEKIAARIAAAHPSNNQEFLHAAFLAVLAVEPTEAELAAATAGLNQLTEIARQQKRPQPELRARINLIQALINHNDFITIR